MFKRETKRIPFHPSWGYVTKEQKEKLDALPLGEERNYLIRQIEKQQKSKGVIK